MDALGYPALGRACLAEFKALVAIDRRIALLDHLHEHVGLRKELFDFGRGMGIGRRGVIAAERLLLRADHALRGGDIVGPGGGDDAEQKHEKQDDGAHGVAPLAMPMSYVLHRNRFPVRAILATNSGNAISPRASAGLMRSGIARLGRRSKEKAA